MAVQFCGTVNLLFRTMNSSFQHLSGMQWTPAQGWAFAGGNYSGLCRRRQGSVRRDGQGRLQRPLQSTRQPII